MANNVFAVATAQLTYKPLHDELLLDITAKSAAPPMGVLFAPGWKQVMHYLAGKMTWPEYEVYYMNLMRGRWNGARKSHVQGHLRQLVHEHAASGICLVLGCYCNLDRGDYHCHRYLAQDILCKVAGAEGVAFWKRGDLNNDIPF